MNRKEYWNENYVKYWKAVTDDANVKDGEKSKIVKTGGNDYKSVGEEAAISAFEELSYDKQDKLLDYGCGFGRFFPYFSCKTDYYGIDISGAMIEECRKNFPDFANRFLVAEGEELPFTDEFFDKVICYGVFDACYQEKALQEMLRVTAIDGVIFLTGKNTKYYEDDEQALIAEEAARKKGHPNYFTNVKKMLECVKDNIHIEEERYYLRRGDTSKKEFVTSMPDKFYEFTFVIKKIRNMEKDITDKFAEEYSNTWSILHSHR